MSLSSFPPTPWSLVLCAGGDSDDAGRAALAELLRRYVPPIRYHLIHHKRLSRDDADDILQGFILQALQRDLIAQAQQHRGKFRTFILTALDRFLVDVHRRQTAQSRNPVSQECLEACEDVRDPAGSPAAAFEVEWARQVLHNAIEQMRVECRALGHLRAWDVFDARILGPFLRNKPAVAFDVLVQRHSLESTTRAYNLLITAKRAFTRSLRDVVRQYTRDEAEADEEIVGLLATLARSSGATRF